MIQYKKKRFLGKNVKKITTFYKKHSYIIKKYYENNILIISIEILYMMTNFI